MPILFQINVTANWGSTGKIAEQIGLCALKHGWQSYIAYGRWCNPSQSHLVKIGEKIDTYLHYAEQRIRDNEGLCSRGATKELIRQIDIIKPDIVHLHNIHDHYLNYRLLFEYLNHTNIKVVWTFHDCWAFTGHCFHFVTKNCYRWESGCYDCPLKNKYPKTLLDKSDRNYEIKKRLFTACKNLTIVSCSNWMDDFVKKSFLKDKHHCVIHNGINLQVFNPHEQNDTASHDHNNVFRIIAVSNVWNTEKGEHDIYQLRDLLPDDSFEITMVGLSKKQFNKLPIGIKGIQRTQNVQELVQLYLSADVLINPTYADTFPTVNLEALACGTPVITYRTGGSPEAVNEKTGFVVEQGNVRQLADTILQMKEFPLDSNDCIMRARQLFDKDKCFEEYIKLYDSLIS